MTVCDTELAFNPNTSIDDVSQKGGNNIKLYPNPLKDKGTIEVSMAADGDATYSIMDINGKNHPKNNRLENCRRDNTGLILIKMNVTQKVCISFVWKPVNPIIPTVLSYQNNFSTRQND